MAIKQLAAQTIWYGLSNVISRLMGFMLTPILTYLMKSDEAVANFGEFSVLYALIAVCNVLFTYGLETGFFRFADKDKIHSAKLFNSTFGSHILSTIVFTFLLIFFSEEISNYLRLNGYAEIIIATALVLAFDTLSTIPFAKLRQEERPRKYAFIKIAGIFINLLLVIFFIYYLPTHLSDSSFPLFQWLLQQHRVFLLVLANLIQAIITFILLYREWSHFRFQFDTVLWKKIMIYSSPMIIIGLAGMVNEVMDRVFLQEYLPYSLEKNKQLVAVYSANYKISIFITLFIQAFRMAAEPFFFKQRNDKNAPIIYANVMKWFVLTLCIAFLFSSLYLDILKYMIGKEYRSALYVVPTLLVANIFLGIYYNLSVWYKIADKMYWGIIITLIGALITFIGNYYFIPKLELTAAAWVTMICYGSMVLMAYLVGQRYYPIPYNIPTIIQYLSLAFIFYFIQTILKEDILHIRDDKELVIYNLVSGTVFMLFFIWFVIRWEKISFMKSLKSAPFIGKFLR